MNIQEVISCLSKFSKECEFFPPLPENEFDTKISEIGIHLPDELLELLRSFDGGELFVPGTTIFGLDSHPHTRSIQQANNDYRNLCYSVPPTYYVFGKLNFGDFLCVNLESSHDVIEWDHEANEEYCKWENITEWLNETIKNYTNESSGDHNANA